VAEVTGTDRAKRINVLYLAPWVDLGGSDRNTVDLLRWIDRDRYRVILATTQESRNRRLADVAPFVDEIWPLPELVPGGRFPSLLTDIIATRQIDVVHVMNSRIGFDLLPDLVALPNAPGILVQLHVEEADRSGYVRLVTTRYGNLVDAWSVSSRQLAGILEEYGVLPLKTEVIYTGVDAEEEFDPAQAVAVPLEPGARHVLFLGRWVEQKDPLLMIEVAARLRDRHPDVQIHAVGEGDQETAMRQRIAELGLEQTVLLHPPTTDVQSWLRASDVMLMTSVYEGIPVMLLNAMAMGVPCVVPALPTHAELMGDAAGSLIEPRDDIDAYVRELSALLEDPALRRGIGETARARVRQGFGLREMADQHGALYDRIVAERAERRRRRAASREKPGTSQDAEGSDDDVAVPLPAIGFTDRSLDARPLVSIVIPCFNHGRWLSETIRSIEEQDYPAIETIVVDDCSTDPYTVGWLAELQQSGRASVIRMPVNGGPSRARNAGIEVARGRYLLPVDSDNLLLPTAVSTLVAQLAAAGETTGFIYPNQQFFGNRDDYAVAPPWNPYRLLFENYCDTCSLYDRGVFDAGLRYAEDIVLGHEDWDLALQLAASGIRGEPAAEKTVLVRKHGFTRSDLVHHVVSSFGEHMRKRHAALYGHESQWGRFGPWAGPAARLKSEWSPYLSIVTLEEVDAGSEAGRRLAQRLEHQTCGDAELLVPLSGRWQKTWRGPNVRRIPPASDDLIEGRLGVGLAMARGRVVLVASGSASRVLDDVAAIEKLALVFESQQVDAIAFIEPPSPETLALGIAPEPEPSAIPHALAWRTDGGWLPSFTGTTAGDELGALARALVAGGARLHWRYLRGPTTPAAQATRAALTIRQPWPRADPLPAALPALYPSAVPRWSGEWHPTETNVLYRHRRLGSEERHLSVHAQPPAGFELDHVLGAARLFSPPGTTKLYATANGSYLTDALPEARASIGPDDRYLGSLELTGFLGLDGLVLGIMYATGQHVLVAGRDDPLLGGIEVVAELGWVEPVPVRPREVVPESSTFGLTGLFRSLDSSARRHRYAVGRPPEGEVAGELGALHDQPQAGSVPLWITSDGLVATPGFAPSADAPSTSTLVRWAAAPANWRGFGHLEARGRSVVRRAIDARHESSRPRSAPAAASGAPAGYVFGEAAPGRVPLFAASHPVTGDQLVTIYRLEAQDMGYVGITQLGWIIDRSPVTGRRDLRRLTVPWASRYGLEARAQ
jgi:glycosyltransferase involved in cell wall biosynthesis